MFEVKAPFRGDTYRAVYAMKIGAVIYVLDVYQKKSHRGGAVPRAIKQRLDQRLQEARADAAAPG